MIVLHFLKKDPTAAGMPGSNPAEHAELRHESDGWFVCTQCATRVARQRWVIDAGSHAPLIFSNPHGHAFSLLLVTQTEGMRHDQMFTVDHTWFAGYEWSIGTCRTCMAHLGWQFRATRTGLSPAEFAALSRDRVRLAGDPM